MARDLIHFAIRKALEKEGWLVIDDPLTVPGAEVHRAAND